MQINSSSNIGGFIALPEELNNKVLDCVVDIKIAILCERVCKLWNVILMNNQVHQINKKFLNVILVENVPGLGSIPKNFVDACGGVKKLFSFPTLDLGNETSNYIDFIKPDQMNAPIMRGVDCHGRFFICMKIHVDKNVNDYHPFNEESWPAVKTCVVTFFNRYSCSKGFMTCQRHLPSDIFGSPGYAVVGKWLSNIKKFVEEKKLEGTIEEHGGPINYSYQLAD